jgi:hypothetical protein
MTTGPIKSQTRKLTYPWRRFWCARGGAIDLSDSGFMRDPEIYPWGAARAEPLTLERLSNHRALILLGEPGMGKSMTLQEEHARLTQGGASGVTSLRVDLRAFSSEDLLYRRIFESQEFLAWVRGSSQLVLHLDSMDEVLLRIDSIASFLADELPRHPTERLSIRIACRTAVWPAQTLEPALKQIWGEAAVGAFELAPLRRTDVTTAASMQGIDTGEFVRAVFEADVVPFAIKPLTLNMLLEIYKREANLPRSVRDIYQRGCLMLCEDMNPSRRDSGRLGSLTAPQRLCVASRVAATTMLANRYAIWTGPDSGDIPPEDVCVSALAGDIEEVNATPFDVSDAHIREVLDTGLFSARGAQQMGWAHQGYAEFLAAEYLVEKEVSPATVLKILRHADGGLIPQLSVVAAWAASLSAAIRQALFDSDPVVLLRGDLSSWDDDERSALTSAYLRALEESRTNDFQVNIASFYHRLAHAGLGALLRRYITDSGKAVMSRRAAIMIAEACSITELEPELTALALNTKEDNSLRARAVAALRTCGGVSVIPLMLPLTQGQAGEDLQNELRGYALQLLWPKHLSATDFFASVVPPNEGFTGSYVMFLLFILPDSLAVSDLPVALGWARSYIASVGQSDVLHLNSLVDSIFVRAWAHIEEDAILNELVAYVRACVRQGGELFRGAGRKERDAFLSALKSKAEPRRRFLRALAREKMDRIHVYPFRRDLFIQHEDLAWLVDVAPGGDAFDSTLNEETLCNLVVCAYNTDDTRQFEQLQTAASRWALLYGRYRYLFEGIPIDSPEAQQAKETHQMMQSFKQTAPPLLTPSPTERIADALERFEAGTWRAFWWLNLHLTLTPTSQYYGSDLEFDLTSLPGWAQAVAPTRERIVKAAERYLMVGKTSVMNWVATNHCSHNDYAAFRAFLLLLRLNPSAYDRLALEVWRKWAPAIAALPVLGDDNPTEQRVQRDALEKAPAEFTAAIRKLIRSHRRESAAASNTAVPGASFLHLRGLKHLWADPNFCDVILAELMSGSNTEDQFAVLADLLLSVGCEPCRGYMLGRLRDGDFNDEGMAVIAVCVLLAYCPAEAWPAVWPLLRDGDEFARRAFLSFAQRYSFRGGRLVALPEREFAELYVRVERLFPRKDDPVHPGGRAHAVGPLEQVGHMRDSLLRQLVGRGTAEAVSALRWAVSQLPDLPWLSFQLREAEQIMRIRTWTPLSVADVRKVTANKDAQLLQVPRDLADTLVESLRRYQVELHGEQTPVRGLWDRQAGGKIFRPVEEDALSDHVKLFLQRDLIQRGIVVNREVEVGRVPGAPVGTRTDIRVQAIRRGAGNKVLDMITAVIETKGCWNSALLTSLKSQLHDDYMTRLGAPVGIYLVGWFDKAKWDPADGRRGATPDISRADAQQQFDSQATALPQASDVRAVVLDCHLP